MATITAAAGGGSWSSTGTWVGGVVPGFTDDVILNGTSGNVNVDTAGCNCQSFDCTGYTGVLSLSQPLHIGDGTSAAGNFTLSDTMGFNPGGSFIFGATTGTNLLTFPTTHNVAIDAFIFNGVGGTWQFQNDLTMNAITGIVLQNGTLEFNGKNVSTGYYQQSGGSLICGASTITLIDDVSGGGYDPVWSIGGGTVSAASATISMPTGLFGTYDFWGGGNTYGTLEFPVNVPTSFLSVQIMDGGNTFTNLTFDNSTNSSLTIGYFSLSGDTTVGTLTVKGYSANIGRVSIDGGASLTLPTPVKITSTTNVFANVDFFSIHGAGTASWNLASITGLSGDQGNNIGITFTSPINCYWVSNTGNWSDNTKWMTATGGATPARVPLPQDMAIFDANSFTIASQTVTVTSSSTYISGMNWTGVTNTPDFDLGVSVYCYGDVTFVSGMTLSNTGVLVFDSSGTQNFTTAGLTLPFSLNLYTMTGTLNQLDDINCSNNNTVSLSGNWNSNSHNVTFSSASVAISPYYTGQVSTLTFNDLTPAFGLTLTGPGPIVIVNGDCNMGLGGSTLQMNGPSPLSFTINGTFTGQVNLTAGTAKFNGPIVLLAGEGVFAIGSDSEAIIGRTTFKIDSSGNMTSNAGPSLWVRNDF